MFVRLGHNVLYKMPENLWILPCNNVEQTSIYATNIHAELSTHYMYSTDRLCGLVVRVSGYRYRGLGFDSRRYQIF